MGTIYTQSDSDFMENPYFEKLADLSCVMWICGGFAPCGPSALLATKNASFGKKDMPFGNPPYHGTKNREILKNIVFIFYLPFMGPKVVFWVKKRWFGVFWTGCEVADLKQRQKIFKMNHRNKIQS